MRTVMSVLAGVLLVSTVSAGEIAPPSFTQKPTAAKAGDKVTIEFAVDRETDVAVYIENGKGEIVRHLAAGVLGTNAPASLKSGLLVQSVEWDGNPDSAGPGSAIPKPEIPFAWPQAVAVGDGTAYVNDRVNQRIVAVKLDYAAVEATAIP